MDTELKPVGGELQRIIAIGSKIAVGGMVAAIIASSCVTQNPRIMGDVMTARLNLEKSTSEMVLVQVGEPFSRATAE